MTQAFNVLAEIIKKRRSTKPNQMDGRLISQDQIAALLELGDWAPTHGHTEPWRFIVYGPDKTASFCRQHAELYKQHVLSANFSQASYDKILHNGDKASHIIATIMQRGSLPKIPVWEEMAAASCSVNNILLGAQSLGIAGFWSTGGMVHHVAMKEYFGLQDEDRVIGLIFLGYTHEVKEGKRTIPLEDKITWA